MRGLLERQDEHGFSFLELMVSLPVLALLLLSLTVILAFSLKSYASLIGDWEMQSQVRLAAEQISRDMATARRVEKIEGGYRLELWPRPNGDKFVEYVLKGSLLPEITKNAQPITGDSSLAQVGISQLDIQVVRGNVYSLVITGENHRTRHAFTIETAVPVYEGSSAS